MRSCSSPTRRMRWTVRARWRSSKRPASSRKSLWYSAYGTYPKSEGGTTSRIVLALHLHARRRKELIGKAAKFLVEIKSIKADIRPEAVMPAFTEEILKKRNLNRTGGRGKALPDSAYTGLIGEAPA